MARVSISLPFLVVLNPKRRRKMADKELFLGPDESAGSRFELFHPNRDLQSNWEVDLAAKLEEYLLKICSGEISSDEAHELHTFNFAEAALLLQGSVQVYSRKVEYLYSLVVRVLEFLSQNRQNLDEKASSNQPDGGESASVFEEDQFFIGLDDVQVDPKNCLDDEFEKEDSPKHFARPPATLLVLEGDCLDSNGDGSELESYLLATCGLYGDFLLLDPSDAKAVHDYSRKNNANKNDSSTHKGSTVRSKTCCSVLKSSTRSGGIVHKSNPGKNQGIDLNENLDNNGDIGINNETQFSGSHVDHDYSDHEMAHVEPTGFFHPEDQSDDDNDDPWKLLNPREPGNLKIKPFKRVREFGRRVYHHCRQTTETSQFPIAKHDGTISPEYANFFEEQNMQEKSQESHSLPLYEKLRRTLTSGEQEYYGACHSGDDNSENGIGDDPSDLDQDEADLPYTMYDTNAEVPLYSAKQGDAAFVSDGFEAFEHETVDSHASLEDLCRFHLDSLLANIAETHKQTEIAARVSTWKQRVEGTLEEQEMRPPFDIHMYGERILDKLQLEADNEGCTSFSNIVLGQPKHEVARTFSALLQLVNNRDADLQKSPADRELICHTATNPFYIRLCGNRCRRAQVVIRSARKRLKSPAAKGYQKSSTPEASSPLKSSARNSSSTVKVGLGSVIRFTPDGKRRRRSARLVEPLDLQSAGS